MPVDVVAHQFLGVVVPLRLVLLAVAVLRVRLEMEEVGADGTVAVLESGQHDAIFHLRHLGADLDRQRVRGRAAPRRIPRPPHSLAHGARLEDVRRAAGADDDGLRAEHVEVARPDIESDGAGDPVGLALVHQQVRDHDPVVDLGRGLARRFGDDRLVAFAVDHDLPLAFALVPPGLGVPHDRKAPFLELVHRGIDVPGDVVAQVFAHQAHQVVAGIADVVLGLVLAPLHAHVAVDRVEALGDGAAALDVRFLDADDLEVASPVAGLVGRSAAGHAAADDEDVRVDEYGFPAAEQTHQTTPCLSWSGRNAGNPPLDLERFRFVREFLPREILRAGRIVLGRPLDRSPGRGPDRGLEVLLAAVPELELPRNGRLGLFPQHADAVPERGEVGIAADIDGVLRAGLHAGVALPAHVRLDVVGPPSGLVDVHDVGRADVDAVPAAVAPGHVNEGWHGGPGLPE